VFLIPTRGLKNDDGYAWVNDPAQMSLVGRADLDLSQQQSDRNGTVSFARSARVDHDLCQKE